MGVSFAVTHQQRIDEWYRQILLILDEDGGFREQNLGAKAFTAKVRNLCILHPPTYPPPYMCTLTQNCLMNKNTVKFRVVDTPKLL